MNRSRFCPGILQAMLLCAAVMPHAEALGQAAWDERLAEACSHRIREIRRELAESSTPLEAMPRIPIDDQGGTGGFSLGHPRAIPEKEGAYAVKVAWSAPSRIDRIALVPARRYDARGLDAQYGMPDAFQVDLLDASGAVVAKVAAERAARADPVRKGHPFVYRVDPPVEASGLRISAGKLAPDPDGQGGYVHAWAEVFAFEGTRNVALGAAVEGIGGVIPPAPWLWSPDFLVDGQTPLGLPEMPSSEHRNVGWLSNGRENAGDSVALMLDLGQVADIDGLRFLPAKRPTTDLPSGFGFPRKLTLSVSDRGDADAWRQVAVKDYRNPGHNPVELPLQGVRGRHVRIEATELWKAFEKYPAFFALSEVEVLSGGRNLALGKAVRSADGMLNIIAPGGRYWSGASLSDGFGPDGRLVSVKEWLERLDERLRLEQKIHHLRGERVKLISQWRSAGLAVFALLGAAGAFAIVALPIRYRIHARRELAKVRERIAGDLHDEVGSNLGSIQMFADLAEGRSGPSEELKRIQRIAAETVSAVRDIVWLLRPGGDHRIATVEHLRETSSIMLESLDWKFHANEEAWQVELPEERTRHLFLFFREALHNILRHAKAATVLVDITKSGHSLRIAITDDGVGIDPAKLERPATLRALRQRSLALGADLRVNTLPDEGTSLILTVPLEKRAKRPPSPDPPKNP